MRTWLFVFVCIFSLGWAAHSMQPTRPMILSPMHRAVATQCQYAAEAETWIYRHCRSSVEPSGPFSATGLQSPTSPNIPSPTTLHPVAPLPNPQFDTDLNHVPIQLRPSPQGHHRPAGRHARPSSIEYFRKGAWTRCGFAESG